MQLLSEPYRCHPPDSKCYYQDDDTRLYHTLHQQRLFFRHYGAERNDLLSVQLVCRTLAIRGDWHRRVNPDFLNITYIHSGETLVRINDFSFVAEPGDLILMPPGSDYEFGTRRKAVRSGLVVQGSLVEMILHNLHGKYVFPNLPAAFVESKIECFFQAEDAGEHQLSVWCFDLLSSLKKSEDSMQVPEEMQKVLKKIKKQLEHPLSLELLAREAGVSTRTLTRLFQKHLQVSPHQYLLRMRMKRACQMLSCEEFSVKEVAISVGYGNALNFSTEFRRLLGCSPTQYRMQKNRDVLPGDLELLPELIAPKNDFIV